ncbi:hypothetical protein ANN_24698 [Periplaneta americana]|uniref:Reverse transcriptase domain-containing protein n=1 Tax=Periplaneta americana TaxID=6978 RepID=A0ABQ8RZG2_PERAM|nr:hypothetical protein ANN_24698 [Periplaneta americana]
MDMGEEAAIANAKRQKLEHCSPFISQNKFAPLNNISEDITDSESLSGTDTCHTVDTDSFESTAGGSRTGKSGPCATGVMEEKEMADLKSARKTEPETVKISKKHFRCYPVYALINYPFDRNYYSALLNEITDLRLPLKTAQDIDVAISKLTRYVHHAVNLASSKKSYKKYSTKSTIPNTQFGFRSSHSCPQQLHRAVDTILDTFEEKSVCLGLFLDTEKAFDKVWHERLLFKLKPIVSDTLFRILQSYLCNRTFSVKYENIVSQVRSIQAGVPQGSVLGPYLYLIYVSDFPRDANLTTAQFADDVAILCKDSCEMAANKLQQFLHLVDIWCNKWKVKMNLSKSYKRKTENQSITLQGEEVSHAESVRYLGLDLDRKLTWNTHISNLVKRLRHKLYQVKHLLKGSSPLPLHLKRLTYFSLIRPIWMYGCGIWGSASNSQIRRIQTIQNRVLRLIVDAPWYIHNDNLHKDLNVPTVESTLRSSYIRFITQWLTIQINCLIPSQNNFHPLTKEKD